jgi:hypothetical protein
MNLSIFNNPDPSGRLYKESYLLKNYPEEYNYIIEYCILNKIFDITFKEKVYLCLNNLTESPKCKNPNCNKKTKYKNSTLGYYEYCSNKCISSDPNIKKIKEEKSLEKFGTKSPAQSKEIKEKIIETNQIKYGGNSPMSNKDIQDKSKKTLLENFGVDNPNKSPEIIKKRVESFKLSNYKETFKETSIKRYGVNHPWMNKEIHTKTIISTKNSKNIKLEKSINIKLEKYTQYELISIDYDKFKRNIVIFCSICNKEFNINREDFHIRFREKTTICTNCNPINSSQSGTEMELYKFIKDNYSGEIITNSKRIIHPNELDIYLPELNLAFEYNGLYWHSESQKGKYYHISKTKKCNEIGIKLIHIWEDDWVYKNEIIKSIVLNNINNINNKIFARKCEISEIESSTIIKEFLNNNHILGQSSSNIKVGLYYDNELVSLMCFLKIDEDSYNLVRFCNKINTIVVGGSSKLFNHFIDKYHPKSIITYSDESMFTGELYKKLGFTFDSYSPINYKWVIGKKREHKSKYRKNRLMISGYDPSKTEDEIMIEDIGSYKIWDCGLKKWILKITH